MSPVKEESSKWLGWMSLIGVLMLVIPLALYVGKFGYNLSNDNAVWGTFGDFMNVFVSVANLVVITFFTYKLDQISQKRTTQERKIEELNQKNETKAKELHLINSKQKEDLVYFSFLLHKGAWFVKNLCESIANNSHTYKSTPGLELPLLEANTDSTAIDQIKENIDHKDIYYAYVNQLNDNSIRRIFQITDYFYLSLKDLLARTEENHTRLHNARNDLFFKIDIIDGMLNQYLDEYNANQETKQNIIDLRDKYFSNKNQYSIYRSDLNPNLQVALLDFIEILNTNKIMFYKNLSLLKDISYIKALINSMIHQNKEYIIFLEHFVDETLFSYNDLSDISKKLIDGYFPKNETN